MQPTDPYHAIDLDTLLEHIRLRGITVGTVELRHLHTVFSRSPALSHNELRDLLANLLAKDENQRHTINRLFNHFIPVDSESQADTLPSGKSRPRQSKPEINVEEDAESEQPEPAEKPLNIWRTGTRGLLLAGLALIIIGLVMSRGSNQPAVEVTTTENTAAEAVVTENIQPEAGQADDFKLVKTIDLWKPTLRIEKVSPWPRLLPPLLLFLGAGLGFIWLLHQALQKTHQRTPKPPRLTRGRGRFHIPALARQADYHLLSGDDRREMSWGIHHYLSDLPLDKLDIKRSVQRSAQTGIPQIEFQQASREREVWLWQEQGSDNPDLIRHAEEIAQTLRPANIHVQRGYFRGLPDQIRNTHGELIWSTRHEYPENRPLVVIFSDAQRLAQAIQQNADHATVTLRLLSEWAQLCFVDHSLTNANLATVLSAHTLDCLLPYEVAGWLAQQGDMRHSTAAVCVLDDLHRWAVACALPDRILAEDEIRGLHDALGLQCGWQFHALKRYAHHHGQGLDFSATRSGLLNAFSQWLSNADPFAQKALDFWQQRSLDIDQSLSAHDTGNSRPWKKTRKQQLLYLDQALLQLWRNPESAAQTLHDQHDHRNLKRDVLRKLGHYTCAGLPDITDNHMQQRILLPWAWDSLEPQVQQQLLVCGFGGQDETLSRLLPDKTTGLVLSLLAGLALSGLMGSVYALWPQDMLIETRLDSPQPHPALILESHAAGQYTLGTYKSALLSTHEKYKNHRLEISWQRQVAQTAQFAPEHAENTQVWLLGTEARPQRPKVDDWPELSLAVIAGDPEEVSVQRLAAHLLDTGNVDRVLIGKDWQQTYDDWRESTENLQTVQWLFVDDQPDYLHQPFSGHSSAYFDQSPAELLALLQGDNAIYPAEKWAATVKGAPFLLARKPDEIRDTIELANNMTLVKIPRGRFQMGSENGADDEKPVHTVNINDDFWMGQTEVTFVQYDAYVADREKQSKSAVSKKVDVPRQPKDYDWGRNIRPVIGVSWEDAQGYVRWLTETNDQELSCRLPSEAEWEYAARAGKTTDYPWGDTASHEQANYGKDECCEGLAEGRDQWLNTAPVGQFPVNPFGLHDMHGNVYEWVQDCLHDNYQQAPVDGSVWETRCVDSRRVLRGGAWYVTPDFLRSAYRDGNYPGFRGDNIGFRVVCSPP